MPVLEVARVLSPDLALEERDIAVDEGHQSGTIAVVGAASFVQAFRTQPVDPM